MRLAANQAAFEHVAVEDQPGGPILRSLATAPPTTLDGALLAVRALGHSATLDIGATQVRVSRAVVAVETKSRRMSGAMVAKLAVVGVLVGAIVMVSRSRQDEPSAAPPRMPELFAKAAEDCPRADHAEARAVAEDQRAIADGARERSPFDPHEARSAVRSYEIAAACYRAAQLPDASEDAAQSARRMREETTLDFRARRVRLERVLAVKDYELAAKDVAVLRALTDGQQGEYPRWLASVAQEIKNQKVEKER